jgi:hypothetical protein
MVWIRHSRIVGGTEPLKEDSKEIIPKPGRDISLVLSAPLRPFFRPASPLVPDCGNISGVT